MKNHIHLVVETMEKGGSLSEIMKGMIKEKGSMIGEMNRRAVYSSEDFTRVIAKEYKVDAVIKPKGRPKKEENIE